MVESAVVRPGAFVKHVVELAVDRGLQLGITAKTCGRDECFAAHGAVGRAAVGINDAEPAVGQLAERHFLD